jgi:hypothetical protein
MNHASFFSEEVPELPPDLRERLTNNPSAIEDIIQAAEARGFGLARVGLELWISVLGIDPSRYDLDAFRNRRVPPSGEPVHPLIARMLDALSQQFPPPNTSQFTEEDWSAVRRLAELANWPESYAVHAYAIAERNEETAADLIFDWIAEHPPHG